ncbi:MAG: PLP-dependent aminotransferase family protein [Stappiaceae bacterium]
MRDQLLQGIVDLDRESRLPLSEQIYRQVCIAVRDGVLPAGRRLPSSRKLASSLGVSRNTVNTAYELLKSETVVDIRTGAAPVIANRQPLDGMTNSLSAGETVIKTLSARGNSLCVNPREKLRPVDGGILEPGVPAFDLFPRETWARSLRRVSRLMSQDDVFYRHVAGLPGLRELLARYLAEERGVKAVPEQVLVTSSTQASLALLAQCFADPGETAFIEEPGYLGARGAFANADLNVLPLPVDNEGAIPPTGNQGPTPQLIYLTPSHQYPLGFAMPLARRLAFIELARTSGAFILEDDYDSEFLFSGRPVASLQGLAAGPEVIYLGTFAKTMLPGIRVAYMVVPANLSEQLSQAIRNMGMMASAPSQAALADFMAAGHYRSHLRKIRLAYQERGLALCNALRARLGNRMDVFLPAGGIQLVARFKNNEDDQHIARLLQQRGVGVSALSATYLQRPETGLIIGFSGADAPTIRRGVDEISAVLSQ